MIWLDMIITLTIDMLNFVQLMTGFSSLIIGMTILGVANSCVDLFVNRALSLQGYDVLALTGLFAGQMFNFLFGFSLNCFSRSMGPGTVTVMVDKENNITKLEHKKFHLFSIDGFFTDKVEAMTGLTLICSFSILAFLTVWIRLKK